MLLTNLYDLQGAAMLFAGVGVYVTQPSHSGGKVNLIRVETLECHTPVFSFAWCMQLNCSLPLLHVEIAALMTIFVSFSLACSNPFVGAWFNMFHAWFLLLTHSLLQLERVSACCDQSCLSPLFGDVRLKTCPYS